MVADRTTQLVFGQNGETASTRGVIVELRESLDQLRVGNVAPGVYGEPYETSDGVTVIPVARISGVPGFGATPVGVFVIHDGKVSWEPAIDATRIALLGEFIGLA